MHGINSRQAINGGIYMIRKIQRMLEADTGSEDNLHQFIHTGEV